MCFLEYLLKWYSVSSCCYAMVTNNIYLDVLYYFMTVQNISFKKSKSSLHLHIFYDFHQNWVKWPHMSVPSYSFLLRDQFWVAFYSHKVGSLHMISYQLVGLSYRDIPLGTSDMYRRYILVCWYVPPYRVLVYWYVPYRRLVGTPVWIGKTNHASYISINVEHLLLDISSYHFHIHAEETNGLRKEVRRNVLPITSSPSSNRTTTEVVNGSQSTPVLPDLVKEVTNKPKYRWFFKLQSYLCLW